MDIRNKKIGFVSLGCDKNRVDLEKMIVNMKKIKSIHNIERDNLWEL